MAKITDREMFDWLLGKGDSKDEEKIKKRIDKEHKQLFSVIKWGGSSFECWEKCDNYDDGKNIQKYSAEQTDLGWDNADVLQRFLSCRTWDRDEIKEMIESVNDGSRVNMTGILLNYAKKEPKQSEDVLSDSLSISAKEAKKNWKFSMDNSAGGYKITGYIGKENHLVMPSFIDGIPVVTTGNSAFKYTDFEYIELSDNLKSIGHSLFDGNGKLVEVRFPDDIEELPKSLFANCSSLRRIELPKNVRTISPWAIGPKTVDWGSVGELLPELEEIWIDPSNEYYETDHGVLIDKKKNMILYFPARIQEYRIPEKVKKLDGMVFSGSQLKHLYVHGKVTSMSDELFIDAGIGPFEDIALLKGLVIHAPKDSYAIEYAKNHNIEYVEE